MVNGGALDDTATLTGALRAGSHGRGGRASEIEIVVALGGGSDRATMYLTNGPDHLVFTASGIDVGLDLDQDITLGGTEWVNIEGQGGDDIIDASAYVAPSTRAIAPCTCMAGTGTTA